MNDQTDHIEELLSKIDQLSVELDQTKKELAQAISERTPHDYGMLKYTIESLRKELHEAHAEVASAKDNAWRHFNRVSVVEKERNEACSELERMRNHLPDATKMIHPEPSRLEIAALILANCRSYDGPVSALRRADDLIEAAKGGAK